MQEVEEFARNVKSRQDFVQFIQALIEDFKKNRKNWENKDLETFLKAVQSWTEDMDGYYVNKNITIPENITWGVFADILIAAKQYE